MKSPPVFPVLSNMARESDQENHGGGDSESLGVDVSEYPVGEVPVEVLADGFLLRPVSKQKRIPLQVTYGIMILFAQGLSLLLWAYKQSKGPLSDDVTHAFVGSSELQSGWEEAEIPLTYWILRWLLLDTPHTNTTVVAQGGVVVTSCVLIALVMWRARLSDFAPRRFLESSALGRESKKKDKGEREKGRSQRSPSIITASPSVLHAEHLPLTHPAPASHDLEIRSRPQLSKTEAASIITVVFLLMVGYIVVVRFFVLLVICHPYFLSRDSFFGEDCWEPTHVAFAMMSVAAVTPIVLVPWYLRMVALGIAPRVPNYITTEMYLRIIQEYRIPFVSVIKGFTRSHVTGMSRAMVGGAICVVLAALHPLIYAEVGLALALITCIVYLYRVRVFLFKKHRAMSLISLWGLLGEVVVLQLQRNGALGVSAGNVVVDLLAVSVGGVMLLMAFSPQWATKIHIRPPMVPKGLLPPRHVMLPGGSGDLPSTAAGPLLSQRQKLNTPRRGSLDVAGSDINTMAVSPRAVTKNREVPTPVWLEWWENLFDGQALGETVDWSPQKKRLDSLLNHLTALGADGYSVALRHPTSTGNKVRASLRELAGPDVFYPGPDHHEGSGRYPTSGLDGFGVLRVREFPFEVSFYPDNAPFYIVLRDPDDMMRVVASNESPRGIESRETRLALRALALMPSFKVNLKMSRSFLSAGPTHLSTLYPSDLSHGSGPLMGFTSARLVLHSRVTVRAGKKAPWRDAVPPGLHATVELDISTASGGKGIGRGGIISESGSDGFSANSSSKTFRCPPRMLGIDTTDFLMTPELKAILHDPENVGALARARSNVNNAITAQRGLQRARELAEGAASLSAGFLPDVLLSTTLNPASLETHLRAKENSSTLRLLGDTHGGELNSLWRALDVARRSERSSAWLQFWRGFWNENRQHPQIKLHSWALDPASPRAIMLLPHLTRNALDDIVPDSVVGPEIKDHLYGRGHLIGGATSEVELQQAVENGGNGSVDLRGFTDTTPPIPGLTAPSHHHHHKQNTDAGIEGGLVTAGDMVGHLYRRSSSPSSVPFSSPAPQPMDHSPGTTSSSGAGSSSSPRDVGAGPMLTPAQMASHHHQAHYVQNPGLAPGGMQQPPSMASSQRSSSSSVGFDASLEEAIAAVESMDLPTDDAPPAALPGMVPDSSPSHMSQTSVSPIPRLG